MTILKKSFFLLVVCILSLPSLYAQKTTTLAPVRKYDSSLIQGNWMLHVNATGSGGNSATMGSHFNYKIAPQIGYLVSNNLAVGVKASFGNERFFTIPISNNAKPYDVKIFTQELFARYYLLPFRLKPFAQVTLGGNRYQSNDKQVNNVKGYKLHGTAVVGAAFFVSPKFSIEAIYNRRYTKDILPQGFTSDGSVFIGLSYFIGK